MFTILSLRCTLRFFQFLGLTSSPYETSIVQSVCLSVSLWQKLLYFPSLGFSDFFCIKLAFNKSKKSDVFGFLKRKMFWPSLAPFFNKIWVKNGFSQFSRDLLIPHIISDNDLADPGGFSLQKYLGLIWNCLQIIFCLQIRFLNPRRERLYEFRSVS